MAGAEDGTVLVVDDDPKVVELLRVYLEREGFTVSAARDGLTAIAALREQRPRVVVLDVMLPALDGLSVLRAARADSDVPVLMLSARGTTSDRISGIASGADDYLAKPFSPAELVVRVKALLRRSGPRLPRDDGILALADLEIDLERHEIRRGHERIAATASDLALLAALVRAGGRVVSREALLDALYSHRPADTLDRTIDVYVRRLREKLGDDPEQPRYVATVRGAGYRAVIDR